MKNQKQILLLSAFLLISILSFSQIAPNLTNAGNWLTTLWASLKTFLLIVLGLAGGYFLAMLGIMYVREIDDDKKKNKYMMGGIVLLGATTVLALI